MSSQNLNISQLKVGLTIFIGLVIFFIFIFLAGSGENYFKETYFLNLFVSDVQGLADGNMVSLGGLKIGSVVKMELKQKDGASGVGIQMEILSKYQPQITENSSAEIKTIGLLGDRYIGINIGGSGKRSLENGAYINYKRTLSMDDISEQLEPVLKDFAAIMNNLRTISDSISGGSGSIAKLINTNRLAAELENAVGGFNAMVQNVKNRQGTLGKLIYSDSLYNRIDHLTDNLSSISRNLAEGHGTLGKLITTDSLHTNLMILSSELAKLGRKLNSDSTVAGGLINDQQLYINLQRLLSDIDSLSVDLKKNPGRYVNLSLF